jgi:hypothetical protein
VATEIVRGGAVDDAVDDTVDGGPHPEGSHRSTTVEAPVPTRKKDGTPPLQGSGSPISWFGPLFGGSWSVWSLVKPAFVDTEQDGGQDDPQPVRRGSRVPVRLEEKPDQRSV